MIYCLRIQHAGLGTLTSHADAMKKHSRSVIVNGPLLRQLRMERYWTQAELARRAGYTTRLIRKAESGGSVDLETLANIAATLSQGAEQVAPQQLTIRNGDVDSFQRADLLATSVPLHLRIAHTFVECYDSGGRNFAAKCGELFTTDVEFHCPADRESVPFGGVWHGTEGVQGFFDAFHAVFTRKHDSLVTEYMSTNNSVVARFTDQVFFQGHSMPSYWVYLHFQFRDGRCYRVDDEFDHYNAKRNFEVLLQRLGTRPPAVD